MAGSDAGSADGRKRKAQAEQAEQPKRPRVKLVVKGMRTASPRPPSSPASDHGAASSSMPRLPSGSPLKPDALDDLMAAARDASIDTSLFEGEVHIIEEGDAIAEATTMLHHRNKFAGLCKCVGCKGEADVMVGSVAFCTACAVGYQPQRPLRKFVHMCPDCGARVVTGGLLADSRTLFSHCPEASSALHQDAIDAHQEVCPDRPLSVCEGVTLSNMHEHACANPYCVFTHIKKS